MWSEAVCRASPEVCRLSVGAKAKAAEAMVVAARSMEVVMEGEQGYRRTAADVVAAEEEAEL